MSAPPSPSSPPPAPEPADAREPVTATRSDDDRDVGWGDDLTLADDRDRDERWWREQRPPHWD